MKKVLIVDNDPDILDAMQEILSYEGYEIKGITHTENISLLLNEYKPNIVLMDYILNGINGGELCHQIKTNAETASIPVVLLSAYPRVLNSLGYYGCDAFIAKPFNLSDLTNCVHQLTLQPVASNPTY